MMEMMERVMEMMRRTRMMVLLMGLSRSLPHRVVTLSDLDLIFFICIDNHAL